MITKIDFKSLDYKYYFNREEIKKLSSQIEIKSLSQTYFICNKNGKIFELIVDRDEFGNLIVYYKGNIFSVEISKILNENFSNLTAKISKESVIKSPMPGLISKIKVKPGDVVKKGDGLFTIEAMKMENEIKSHISGIVDTIRVNEGTVVEKNAVLIILKPGKYE